jgi:hypothetical protein
MNQPPQPGLPPERHTNFSEREFLLAREHAWRNLQ